MIMIFCSCPWPPSSVLRWMPLQWTKRESHTFSRVSSYPEESRVGFVIWSHNNGKLLALFPHNWTCVKSLQSAWVTKFFCKHIPCSIIELSRPFYCCIWRLFPVFSLRWPLVKELPWQSRAVQWVLRWVGWPPPPGPCRRCFPHALRNQRRPRPHVLLLGIVQSLTLLRDWKYSSRNAVATDDGIKDVHCFRAVFQLLSGV